MRVPIIVAVAVALFATGLTAVLAAPQDVVDRFELVPDAGEQTTKLSGSSFRFNWRLIARSTGGAASTSPVVTVDIPNPRQCVTEVRASRADADHLATVTQSDGAFHARWTLDTITGGQSLEIPVIITTNAGACADQERIPVTASLTDASGVVMPANGGQPLEFVVTTGTPSLNVDLSSESPVRSDGTVYAGQSNDGGAHLSTDLAALRPVVFQSRGEWSGQLGYRQCTSASATYTLPPGAVLDPARPGGWTVSADGRSATKATAETGWSLMSSQFGISLLFPGAATLQPNAVTVTATCVPANPMAGEKAYTATANSTIRLTSQADQPPPPWVAPQSIEKTGPDQLLDQEPNRQQITYNVTARNWAQNTTMTFDITEYSALSTTRPPNDRPSQNLDARLYFDQIDFGANSVFRGSVDVLACRNSGPPTLVRTLTLGEQAQSVPLPDGRTITCLQVRGTNNVPLPSVGYVGYTVVAKFRDPTASLLDGNQSSSLCNTAYLAATYGDGRAAPVGSAAVASHCLNIVRPTVTATLEKGAGRRSGSGPASDPALVGDVVTWGVSVSLNSNMGVPADLTGTTVIDLLPPGFEYLANHPGYEGNRPPDSIVDNYHNSGRQALIWEYTRTPGTWELERALPRMTIPTRVTSSAAAGVNTNTAYFIPRGRVIEAATASNQVVDEYDLNNNGSRTDNVIAASGTVSYMPPKVLLTHKLVQGSQDQSLLRAPQQGATTYNKGAVNYSIRLLNNALQNIANLTIIDVLPDIGDHTIASDQASQNRPRNSQFPVRLTGPIIPPPGREGDYTITYTTAATRGRTAADLNTAAAWTATPADWSAVTAFRIVMNPGRSIAIGGDASFAVRAALTGDSIDHAGQTAYNSYAVSVAADGTGFFESDIVGVKAIDPNPHLVSSIAVNPGSGTAVKAGDVLTYALILDNSKGGSPAPVALTNSLTGLLDDATIERSAVTSTNPAVATAFTSDGNSLNLTGSVPPGQIVTIRYTATVKVDGQRGDGSISSCLGDQCATNSAGQADLNRRKLADPPSGTGVTAGSQVTYSLVLDNSTGTAAATVTDLSDWIAGVVDDATLDRASLVSSSPSITAVLQDDGYGITLNGTVPAGQRVTVTYRVTVKPLFQRGDDSLFNCLGSYSCTTHPVDPPPPNASKFSTPIDGTPLPPGQEVTYTLRMNDAIRKPDGTVDATDDLSDLVDDMDIVPGSVISHNVALSALLSADGRSIRVVTLPGYAIGPQSTVTYRAVVKPAGQGGNGVARNCFAGVHCVT